MGWRVGVIVASAVIACGTSEAVLGGGGVTGADASTGAPLAPTTDVVPWEPCTPGHERIVLSVGASVHILRRLSCSGQYEAGVPGAMVYSGSEDGPILFSVWGCDDAGAFSTNAETPDQSLSLDVPVDAAMGTYLDYGTISVGNSYGKITVDDWPDAGGLVSGTFAGEDPSAQAPLSGTFCVVRLPAW
jgi:hypothetical protein